MKPILLAGAIAAIAAASPAAAVTNLIKNGSFEAGAPGVGNFTNWTKSNTPDGTAGQGDQAAAVISYNNFDNYPTGAYGELVLPNNAAPPAGYAGSPDAVGNQAAYFVGDRSVNETISQLTYLGVGNYEVGFSRELTNNGLANPNNSSIAITIIGTLVAMTAIDGNSPGQQWLTRSGVAQITKAGWYLTSLVYNSNGYPAKDIVVDNVYARRSNLPATVSIPPTPATVPEPATWALLVIGFGMVGVTARRRKAFVTA